MAQHLAKPDEILNSVIESEEVYEPSDGMGVSFDNGVVSLNGDKTDENSFNFMMMMAAALMLPEASNNLFNEYLFLLLLLVSPSLPDVKMWTFSRS